MSSLRSDGEFTFYVIQHKQSDGRWVGSSFDFFGTPEGFSASGVCWQQTGNHGTFDRDEGVRGLQWISERHKGKHFRLAEVYIKQASEVIADMFIRDKEPK